MGYAVAAIGMRPCDFYAMSLAEYYEVIKAYKKVNGVKDEPEDDPQEFIRNYVALNGLES